MFGQLVGVRQRGQALRHRDRAVAPLSGQRGFSPVARTFTNAAGTYSFVMPAGLGHHQPRLAGDRPRAARAGPSPSTSARWSRWRAPRRSRSRATSRRSAASSRPVEPGEVVSLQRRVGPRWHDGRPAAAEARRRPSRSRTRSPPAAPSSGARWSRRPSSNLGCRLAHAEDQDRAADRDPQDPARRDHHAGEPLVRQLLRHLPRRRRDSRPGVCVPDPVNGGCVAPFHDPVRPQLRRPAFGEQRRSPTSTTAGWTGSSPRPSRA